VRGVAGRFLSAAPRGLSLPQLQQVLRSSDLESDEEFRVRRLMLKLRRQSR